MVWDELPEGWELRQLAEVAHINMGQIAPWKQLQPGGGWTAAYCWSIRSWRGLSVVIKMDFATIQNLKSRGHHHLRESHHW